MTINPDEIRLKAEIDKLLTKANVHRIRNEYIEAEDALREALALDETRADIREMIADMLYARGQLEPARDEYKKVIDSGPGHAKAEMKYAKVSLEIGEREYQKQLAIDMLENPGKYAEPPRHPLAAFLASALVPGLGQLYNREYVKAAIIFGTFVLSLLILAFSPDTGNLLKAFGMLVNPSAFEPGSRVPPIGPLVYLFSGIITFLYIYTVIDAPITAAKRPEPTADALIGAPPVKNTPAVTPPKVKKSSSEPDELDAEAIARLEAMAKEVLGTRKEELDEE